MRKTKNFLVIILTLFIMVFAAACGSEKTTSGEGTKKEDGDKGKEITIGYIPWDEDVAVSFLWKNMLENKGYKVNLVQADVAPVFSGVAKGNIDLFLDVWMPSTHATYMEKFGTDLEVLGRWYDQADNGLAVPDYMNVHSIEDLNSYKDKINGKIIGIEAGAGLMRLTRQALPAYGLNSLNLIESSTPAMLAELDKAVSNKEPIVVTLWRPHWAFDKYKLRYLDDPKHLMNPKGAEELQSVSRKGFSKDFPEVTRWIKDFKISSDQLAKLESQINSTKNQEEGVKKWVSENKNITNGWTNQ